MVRAHCYLRQADLRRQALGRQHRRCGRYRQIGEGKRPSRDFLFPDHDRSLKCLTRAGRLVTCGATTGHDAQVDLRFLFSRQLSLLGSYMGRKSELLRAAQFFFAGQLRPVVDQTFPLAEAAEAHRRLEARQQFGKIVLVP